MRLTPIAGGLAALTATMLVMGCGYQQTGSTVNAAANYHEHSLFRDDVKTVAIPIFSNRTYYRGVEFSLTQAVVKDLEAKSPYKVVPRERADSILEGEVTNVRVRTISHSPAATPQEQLYLINVNFTWKDLRSGKILVSRKEFEQTASYYPTLGEGQFTGSQENVERLAEAIVEELEADW